MIKLLNIDANPKTVKGQKKGYMTAVLYLSPYKISGVNVCPTAKQAGCFETCLNTSGRGGIAKSSMLSPGGISIPDNTVQRARLRRTAMWNSDRTEFFAQLVQEIGKFREQAGRKGLTPVVRLNGTSDIQWEKQEISLAGGASIFRIFPDIQFYDYTKLPKRFEQPLEDDNYYLCLSYSEASLKYADRCLEMQDEYGVSLVYVALDRDDWMETLEQDPYPVVNGDENDLRFLDPPGAQVVLKAKGRARRETNGFVIGAALPPEDVRQESPPRHRVETLDVHSQLL